MQIDIDGRAIFHLQQVKDIFVSRANPAVFDVESGGQLADEISGCQFIGDRFGVVAGSAVQAGQQFGIVPDGLTIPAPKAGVSPARQRFSGVPFSLAVVQEATGSESLSESADELIRKLLFVRANGGGIPFGAFHIIDGYKSGFSAHGESNILFQQSLIDVLAAGIDLLPCVFCVRQRDSRIFVDAGDLHLDVKGHFAAIDSSGDGSGGLGCGCGGQRNVAFTCEQPGCGIKSDPACSGQVDFGPCVQVSEVSSGAGGSFEWLLIGGELDQVA